MSNSDDSNQKPEQRFFRSDLAESLLKLDGQSFSLTNYPFYRAIYDGQYQRMLLINGRQTAKCVPLDSDIFIESSNTTIKAKDVKVGDEVLSYDRVGGSFRTNKVIWKSDVQEKPCVRITTSKNERSVVVAMTHPMLTGAGYWMDAGNLSLNEALSLVKTNTEGTETYTKYNQFISKIELVGLMPCVDFEVERDHTFVVDGFITHNSTTMSNYMIMDSIGMPHFKSLYVSPSKEQTQRFSHTRVSQTLAHSSHVRDAFLTEGVDNVFLRVLKNGSQMIFSYANTDADRVRGVSADRIALDEVQDMDYQAVVPVIEESSSASKYGYVIYAGTPKTSENTIETLWQKSSMTEWVMKCDGCNKHTYIRTAACIGKNGPECLNCRKPLNARNGKWVDTQAGKKIKAFHIPQLIMPDNTPAAWRRQEDIDAARERWSRIIFKHENMGETKFSNEVLGVSSSQGARMLTLEELNALCDENHRLYRLPQGNSLDGVMRTIAGVDWSGDSNMNSDEDLIKSRTAIVVLGQMTDGTLKVLYYKALTGDHSLAHIDEIAEIVLGYNCQFVACDAGGGMVPNAVLRNKVGPQRVIAVRYCTQGNSITWKPETSMYHVDRTTVIDSVALMLKKRGIKFASLKEMKVMIDDILSIYEETSSAGNKLWKKVGSAVDDNLHALTFATIAMRIATNNLGFYT